MNSMELKCRMMKDLDAGNMVYIHDNSEEFKQLQAMYGSKLVVLNLNCESSFIDTLLLGTEPLSLETREKEFEDLLKASENSKEYAKARLSDLSFLDSEPDWKERVRGILERNL